MTKYGFEKLDRPGAFLIFDSPSGHRCRESIVACAYKYGRKHGFRVTTERFHDGSLNKALKIKRIT